MHIDLSGRTALLTGSTPGSGAADAVIARPAHPRGVLRVDGGHVDGILP